MTHDELADRLEALASEDNARGTGLGRELRSLATEARRLGAEAERRIDTAIDAGYDDGYSDAMIDRRVGLGG